MRVVAKKIIVLVVLASAAHLDHILQKLPTENASPILGIIITKTTFS